MIFLIKNPFFVFSLFTIPVVGWVINRYFTQKVITIVLYTSVVLLLPILVGYNYVSVIYPKLLIYVTLALAYSNKMIPYLDRTFSTKYNFTPSIIFSIVLIFVCGFSCLMLMMLGTVTIEREWTLKKYRVQYVVERGFSGGPLKKYELGKFAAVPFFIRDVDTKIDNDTTHACSIKFVNEGFTFDKCKPDDNSNGETLEIYMSK